MLLIFDELFSGLNKENIGYCIYKGYSHLGSDLSNASGDIDILLNEKDLISFEKIIFSYGFIKNKRLINRPLSYFKFDIESHSMIKLDVDFVIRVGDRPDMEYYLEIDFDKLSLYLDGQVMKLSIHDYIPLMIIMRVFSNKRNNENFYEIKKSIKYVDFSKSYVAKIIEENGIVLNDLKSFFENSNNWNEFAGFFTADLKSLKKIKLDLSLFLKKKNSILFKILGFFKRKVGVPTFIARKKGLIVAFVGVDGAGKTSSIDYIEGLEFFKKTGVKKIYFGNNEFWMPGLNFLLKNRLNNRIYSILLSILTSLDRQLRIIGAIYYRKLGNIVLADRYFYDDQIARDRRKKINQSLLKKTYHKIFDVKMLVKPDLTIFLDVSPEVAYSRKQDYSYETMLEINSLYKNYMSKVDGVVVINSDLPKNKVHNLILDNILDVEYEKNN